MSVLSPSSSAASMTDGDADAAQASRQATARVSSSEFEEVRLAGFRGMRFPAAMEAAYHAARASERLVELRVAGMLFVLLNIGIFSADWLMVPDQFRVALALRLLVLIPLALAFIGVASKVASATREWLLLGLGTSMACVGVALPLLSTDALGPAYLMALELILLFNSGVANMPWRMQMRASAVLLLSFAFAVWALPAPPVVIMAAMALVLVSTALYTLVGAYRHEREDRTNWLMRKHEQLLMAELHRENARLTQLSRFDPLTSLPNRRHADAFIAQVWERCRHAGEEVALLMLDVDHFKAYNDHHGHQQGDACLRAVAGALQGLLRPEDMVARFGGEEFIAVLPKASLAVAMAAAERLRHSVAQLDLPHAASPDHKRVTLSIGVASIQADLPGTHPGRLMAAADVALYEAKSTGRNRVAAFSGRELPKAQMLDAQVIESQMLEARTPDVPMANARIASASMANAQSTESPAHDAQRSPPRPTIEHERAAVAAASASFDASDWALRFPPALERQFLDQVALRLHYFSVSGLLSLVVFNGFLFVDYLMIPDVFAQAVQVRLGWFTPFALSIQFALRYRREWVLRHFSASMIESVILLRSVLTAVCMAYLLSISHNPLSQYYHVGLVVIVVYVNAIQRLRFWYAVVFSLVVLGISFAQALMLPAFEPRLIWPITLLLAVTVVFTLMPVYALERDERRRFLLTRRRAHLLEDLAEVQQRLQALSSTDALTGLSNRRHLRERLEQVWRRAQHDRSEMSILMLDVDHFKAYNDRYGHLAGDHCLASIARVLADCVRGPADIAARFGGEEFIVVLPGTNGAGAQRVAERILQAVQALGIAHEASATSTTAGVVTLSIGVATCRVGPDRNHAFLIASADSALYIAKQAGRNRVQRAL